MAGASVSPSRAGSGALVRSPIMSCSSCMTSMSTTGSAALILSRTSESVSGAVTVMATYPGDFNLDGKLDVAVVNSGANTASVHLGSGDGKLGLAIKAGTTAGPRVLAATDFNADGLLDLVTANATGGDATVLLNTSK